MRFYLSGGMEFKKDLGIPWREWLTSQLQQIGGDAIDPVKMEVKSPEGTPIQTKITELKINGDLDEVRSLVRNFLFKKDMRGIQQADAMVLYYDTSVQKGAGTLAEAWEAFREGKPVYVVTDFPLEKTPSWLIGETTQIFSGFEEFLTYVKDFDKVTKDINSAKKIRDEVLAGIY